MNIAAVVILYNPSPIFIDYISSYIDFVKAVYVIDNSEAPDEEITAQIGKISNCTVISDGQNKGIAKRLNQASALAKKAGFSWLLTMDQDSFFKEQVIATYLNCIDTYPHKNETAIFGVQYNRPERSSIHCNAVNTTHLITSGSVINLNLFLTTEGFDERLFIDQVDYDYCYKSILSGHKVIQFENIFLQHSLGISSEHRSLKTLKQTTRTLHSPVRLYYMTRNFLYIRSKYRKFFKTDIIASKKALLNTVKNNIIYSKHRLSVIVYILKGIFDFFFNRMGKLGEPSKK